MPTSEHLLPILCAASGVAWAVLAALRLGTEPGRLAARGLLGGVGAVSLASAAYDLAQAAGLAARWEVLVAGGASSIATGAGIGLVEEGAKLAGLLLAVERGWRKRDVAAAALGVAAGFAALEAAIALRGTGLSAPLLARVLLAPAAHAALAIPLAAAVAAAVSRGGRAWLWLGPGLAASAALHGAGDLSLAVPGLGRGGYALALLAPVLVAFALTRAPRRGRRRTARRTAAQARA